MQKRTIKNLAGFTFALALFTSSLALPALAMPDAQNSTDSTKAVLDTQITTCDNQTLLLKGKVHDVYHFTISDDGNFTLINEENYNLTGELYGVTYVANGGGNSSNTGKFMMGQATTEFTTMAHLYLISRAANTPSLYMRIEQHVTINRNGDVTAFTYNFREECQ